MPSWRSLTTSTRSRTSWPPRRCPRSADQSVPRLAEHHLVPAAGGETERLIMKPYTFPKGSGRWCSSPQELRDVSDPRHRDGAFGEAGPQPSGTVLLDFRPDFSVESYANPRTARSRRPTRWPSPTSLRHRQCPAAPRGRALPRHLRCGRPADRDRDRRGADLRFLDLGVGRSTGTRPSSASRIRGRSSTRSTSPSPTAPTPARRSSSWGPSSTA